MSYLCSSYVERVGDHTNIIHSYRKVPKFSDDRKLCCKYPNIQTKRRKFRVFHQRDASGIANSEDLDLGLYCLPGPICPKN